MRRPIGTLRAHWPEYLMEAAGLGAFMVSAGLFATLLEHPESPLRQALPDPLPRRGLMGLAMGLTSIALVYSPWGRRSGAHLNPAMTLAWLRLGKVAPLDAVFYVASQFIGGAMGALLVAGLLGRVFTDPPISAVATTPGPAGPVAALLAETVMAFGLMLLVLTATAATRLMRLTGLFAGALIALYVTVEAPLSGMSLNPARTTSSALASGVWDHLWIYFLAPPLGMFVAVEAYRALWRDRPVACAKLDHSPCHRCIHCGYQPPVREMVHA
jgi:aquaporin Z